MSKLGTTPIDYNVWSITCGDWGMKRYEWTNGRVSIELIHFKCSYYVNPELDECVFCNEEIPFTVRLNIKMARLG